MSNMIKPKHGHSLVVEKDKLFVINLIIFNNFCYIFFANVVSTIKNYILRSVKNSFSTLSLISY